MNIEPHNLMVGGVKVQVVRKTIKNLHLGVYPPHGRVRVAAPFKVSDNAVRLAVIGKLGWIKRQRAKFENQSRQSKRELVRGESHYYLGRRYRLRVVHQDGPPKIALRTGSIMELTICQRSTIEKRQQILNDWYRQRLKLLLPPIIEKWQGKLGVRASKCGIKKMKTKWGSCNPKIKSVWINLELAKKPIKCLEYIVVHELVHLLERRHGDRFTHHMDRALPRWRVYRDELNRAPLGYEEWGY